MQEDQQSFYLTVIPGLESATHLELCSRWERAPDFFNLSDFPNIKSFKGGIEFQAPLQLGLELSRHLRTVTRILLRLSKFEAPNEKQMLKSLKQIDWSLYFEKGTSFDFGFTSKSSRLSMTKQMQKILEETLKPLKLKHKKGSTKIFIRIIKDQCEVSMDLMGEASFKRHEGVKGSIASLRASTAASLLRYLLQGLDEPCEIIDPMCGSGTWIREAFLFNTPLNRSFLFESFPCYEKNKEMNFKTMEQKLIQKAQAFDKNEKAFSVAKKNLASFDNLNIEKQDLFEKHNTSLSDLKRVVVVNPPWGKRLTGAKGDILQTIYEKYQPHRIGFLMPAHWKMSEIPLEKVRDIPFKNSGVDNRFLIYS